MNAISDPLLFFTALVSITLIVPLIAEKLKLPDMVLLLLSGAFLGPHGLGLLERNDAILLFASVGLLYIMFLAGIEIDLHRFISSSQRSILFGLLTFTIPQVIGTLLGRYALSMEWPAAMLLASMFASHTLLAYPVASRLGIVRAEPVAVAIGATIITDTLALLVLALIADSAKGIEFTWGFWVGIVVGMTMLVVVGLTIIPWLSRWFFRHVGEDGGAQFLFVIGVVCVYSYASHFARIEPIIGAFLAGIAFNRLIPEQSTLMNRVEFVGKTLFIPFFLISVGMLIDLRAVLRDPRSWLVAGTMVCGVITTKWLAARIAQYLFGYTRDEGNVLFGLSVVQAAATLAAVLVGFELDIFSESVLNGAIAMIMVTCPLGSWVVDRYGRNMVARAEEEPAAPQRGEQRLLVPVTNLDTALHMLDLAFVLRDTTRPGMIYPMVVVPDEGITDAALANGEKLMGRCVAHAASAEIPAHPFVRIEMNASDGIVRTAREIHADVVLFGWGVNLTVATRIFGTVRKRMLQECPARLLICRLVLPLNTTRRILLPLPPQAERRADIIQLIQEAKRLSKQLGADLHAYLCDPDAAPHLRALLDKARPEIPVTVHENSDWPTARVRLFEDIKPDDMALLPVERRRGALWSPSLDRLPDVMAARFPAMNLIAAYPQLASAYQHPSYDVIESPTFSRIMPVSLHGVHDMDEALRALTEGPEYWDIGRRQAIHALLRGSANTYPVEMAPETVLLHAHCPMIDDITLLVGMSNRGWEFPGVDAPARVILALISPSNLPPENHLAALSSLARAFHDKELADQVCRAGSAEDIALLLRDTLHVSSS